MTKKELKLLTDFVAELSKDEGSVFLSEFEEGWNFARKEASADLARLLKSMEKK